MGERLRRRDVKRKHLDVSLGRSCAASLPEALLSPKASGLCDRKRRIIALCGENKLSFSLTRVIPRFLVAFVRRVKIVCNWAYN